MRGTDPPCVILCPASVLFSEVTGLDSVSFAHTTVDTKLFQICSTAGLSDFFSEILLVFLRIIEALHNSKNIDILYLFPVRGNYFLIFYAPQSCENISPMFTLFLSFKPKITCSCSQVF